MIARFGRFYPPTALSLENDRLQAALATALAERDAARAAMTAASESIGVLMADRDALGGALVAFLAGYRGEVEGCDVYHVKPSVTAVAVQARVGMEAGQ